MTSVLLNPTALVIETFRAAGDGCLGYLVVDEETRSALAVDPRLDQVGALRELLLVSGWRLRYVVDTHTHADHLSGAWALGEATQAPVVAHTASRASRIRRRVSGGDTLDLGTRSVRVLDAPGHTPDSMALLVDGHLFTGDALLAGGAGRTDFPGGSASALFDTLAAFRALPRDTVVHPGHDYVGRGMTTLGEELAANPALRETDRAAFVARFGGSATPPANMETIVRHNLGEDATSTVAPVALQALAAGPVPPVLLDVRSPLEFESEHIAGSLNVPVEALASRLEMLPSADIVLICRSGVRATVAADTLARGGRRARVLEGGILAWRRARLPLREGRKRLAVDRQVQLVAGGMVLLGSALTALVSPWFLLVPAFFGAGLAFAGATGTCGLALVLMKLPWNRPRAVAEQPPAVCAAGSGPASCAAPVAEDRGRGDRPGRSTEPC
jgi:glyoxylase-like metal-dependent hydrolase (beta-lactamase superfamily II)